MLKKILVRYSSVLLLTICLSTSLTPVYAAVEVDSTTNSDAISRAEETEWKYRVVDGKLQKRLWSITYAIWLTEWEWV